MDNKIVTARGLRKLFGKFEAVKGIDFDISERSCFGFLGPNGAGKTTTMAMIYCATKISEGDLKVFGLDAKKSPRKIKEHLGVSHQEDNLDPELSTWENLWVYGHYYGIKRDILRKRIDYLIDLMQLRDKRKLMTQTLSGGMKRRLMIARALLNNPKLLVLDEPTTGLDPQARHLIWQKLEQLKREGTTMILTTHYMDEAERLCDDLVIMDHGIILDRGAPKHLISKHVGKDVVEVNIYEKNCTKLLELSKPYISESERVGEQILLYPHDPSALIQELLQSREYEFTHRMTTLEDVFLRLTGRDLRE